MFKLFLNSLYLASNIFLNIISLILWPKKRPKTANTVCIFRIGNIGDTICALAAMQVIRQTYPGARLILLTSPGSRGMPGAYDFLRDAPWLDDIIVYYSDEIDTLSKKLKFISEIRKEKIDAFFELPNNLTRLSTSIRNMLSVKLMSPKWAYGWRISTIRWKARFQSEKINFPNETDRLLDILSKAGLKWQKAVFPLPIQKGHRHKAESLISKFENPQKQLVALAPGAKRSTNKWPLQRFAKVAEYLNESECNIILIGGPGDYSECQEINYQVSQSTLNTAGETNILETAALLERCKLAVVLDSGVQHIAAAVDTSCITMSSARDIFGKWFPYGNQHKVIRKWPGCHTCFLEKCPYDNLCMNMISTDEVIEAIYEKLKTI